MKEIIKLIRKIWGFYRVFNLEKELLCSQKFNNTIAGSKWFIHQDVSPGGFAIDYTFFYSLYRVLDSIRPQNIIEFGLGQSSKMIHQYADYYNVTAITIEHDKQWADFFKKCVDGKYQVNIKQLAIEEKDYKGEKIEVYKDCVEEFKNQKFDLVVIDGPINLDKRYARIDVLSILENNLSENFIIMIDDYNAKSIKNTMQEVMNTLDILKVDYVYGVYTGQKSHLLLTTPQNIFLTTL